MANPVSVEPRCLTAATVDYGLKHQLFLIVQKAGLKIKVPANLALGCLFPGLQRSAFLLNPCMLGGWERNHLSVVCQSLNHLTFMTPMFSHVTVIQTCEEVKRKKLLCTGTSISVAL